MFSVNVYFKRDSICCTKFYSCNKNLIKHLFARPIARRSHSILFYLGTACIPNKNRIAMRCECLQLKFAKNKLSGVFFLL